MPLDAWIAVGVVLTIFPLMALSRLGPDIILLGAVVVLMTLGVIDPQQALGGFSNSGLFTVAFMYVLVASIRAAMAQVPTLDPKAIEDAIIGCSFPEGEQGFNVARLIGLLGHLPLSVGGATVNRFCGSSMQAIHMAAGAIQMNADGLPVVDLVKCTACGDCVDACPKGLFALVPENQHLFVQCRNLVEGDRVLEQCKVACTACGKCVMDAAPGLISVASGVAVIDSERALEATPAAAARCPTGAILWLEGAQFADVPRAGASNATRGQAA